MKNPFTKPAEKPTNQNPLAAVLDELKETAAATERYLSRRGEIEAEAAQPPTLFDLTVDECEAYGKTTAALAFAKSLEGPLRAKIRTALDRADRARNQAESRIRARHAEIDQAMRDSVAASLPDALQGIIVTTETDLAARGSALTAATGGGIVGNKISIWTTGPGRAESAARLDTTAIRIEPVAPDAGISTAQQALVAALTTIEHLAAEEARCARVLAKYSAADKAA